MRTYRFRAQNARRVADPVFGDQGVDRHTYLIPVRDYPAGMPLEANARVPKLNRRIYQDVEKSLLNQEGEPNTFHLKHKGIVVVADAVRKVNSEDDLYDLLMEEGEVRGVVDGGHTNALINVHIAEGDLPEKQYVEVRVYTKVPEKLIPELSRGLNTSMQVQPFALDNLAHRFDTIKKVIGKQPYASEIAWRENEDGTYDARDLVSIMLCFNTALYPTTADEQPVEAYEKKSEALNKFEERPETFEALLPILPEILRLHDIIRYESRSHWNEQGGQFGNLAFVEKRKRGQFESVFTDAKADYRLMNGALMPMLAAFRWMVETDPDTGEASWRGGFDNVLSRWGDSAAELMRMTATASHELGRNPNAIGKSRNHWSNLIARVAMRDLMEKEKAGQR